MFKEIRQNGRSIVKVMKNGSIIWQKPNPGILPAGYIECEYLERDRSYSYINTGVRSDDCSDFVIDVKYLFAADEHPMMVENPIISTFDSTYDHWNYFVCKSGLYGYTSIWATGHNYSNVQFNDYDIIVANIHGVKKSNGSIDLSRTESANGGAPVSAQGIGHFTNNNPTSIHLFSRGDLNIPENGEKLLMRIYSYSITKDNVLAQNLIPCLDNLGVPCMYDTISKTTFYNQGTGTFGYKIKDPELEYAGYGTLYKLPLGDTYIKDFGWMRGYYHDLHANVGGSGASDAFTGLSNPILIEPGYTYTVVRPSPSGADNSYNAWFPVPAPGRPGETAKNYKLLCGGDPMSQEMSQPSDARYLYVSFKAYNTANFDRNYNGIYITKSRTV